MKDIFHYDSAAKSFYEAKELKSMPIMAWDLFSVKFTNTCALLKDALVLEKIAASNKWQEDMAMKEALLGHNHIIVVTDLRLNIVHATANIEQMNGYHPDEVIGKQPKLFQGPETCQETTLRIRTAIEQKQCFETTILNYRKDGSTYYCWIKGMPVRNKKGKVVNFIAYEKEVA